MTHNTGDRLALRAPREENEVTMATTTKIAHQLMRLSERSKGVAPRAYVTRLQALVDHFGKTKGAPSPAMVLHRNGARAVLFQLEALARLHRTTLDDAVFQPLVEAFKSLEDGLGRVDFFDALLRRMGDRSDAALRGYFLGRRAEACANVARLLELRGWLDEADAPSAAVASIVQGLRTADWPNARRERLLLGQYFANCALKIHAQLAAGGFDLGDVEQGVHEVRRKIRWLSILPAAVDGLFVREDADGGQNHPLDWYRKPEVVASPFNNFPRRENVPEPLMLDSSAFLAVSWLIAELGLWKDRGQNAEAILAAWRELGVDDKQAIARTHALLGEDFVAHAAIKRAVTDAVKRLVGDEVLPKLARGVGG